MDDAVESDYALPAAFSGGAVLMPPLAELTKDSEDSDDSEAPIFYPRQQTTSLAPPQLPTGGDNAVRPVGNPASSGHLLNRKPPTQRSGSASARVKSAPVRKKAPLAADAKKPVAKKKTQSKVSVDIVSDSGEVLSSWTRVPTKKQLTETLSKAAVQPALQTYCGWRANLNRSKN